MQWELTLEQGLPAGPPTLKATAWNNRGQLETQATWDKVQACPEHGEATDWNRRGFKKTLLFGSQGPCGR
jgi:hypothetical protein